MPETLKNLPIESIINLYKTSEELLLVLDAEKNPIFLNKSAKNLFGDIKKITEIEHFFSFNVCILDRDKFFDYNPIREIMNFNTFFSAETLFQLDSNLYRNLNIRSFSVQNKKIIILSDVTEKIQNISLKSLLAEIKRKSANSRDKNRFNQQSIK